MSKFWLFGFFAWPVGCSWAGAIQPVWLKVIILGCAFFLMCMGFVVFWRLENKVKTPLDRKIDVLREKNAVLDELMLGVFEAFSKQGK